jgi:tetratricopeptide (TPR) repeat protein
MVQARQLAARAQVHFDLGEYAPAVDDYRAAFRLVASPGLLYNLAQAYRLMGDCVDASTTYRTYLRLAPASPYRSMVRQHLATLGACELAEVTGAAIPERISLAPAPSRRPGHIGRLAGLGLAGAGVELLAVAAYFAVDAAQASAKVSDLYARGAAWDEIAVTDARGVRSDDLAATLFVGGAVAVVSGAALYYLGWRGWTF